VSARANPHLSRMLPFSGSSLTACSHAPIASVVCPRKLPDLQSFAREFCAVKRCVNARSRCRAVSLH
jgi:hypothetical protein